QEDLSYKAGTKSLQMTRSKYDVVQHSIYPSLFDLIIKPTSQASQDSHPRLPTGSGLLATHRSLPQSLARYLPPQPHFISSTNTTQLNPAPT
ncbi:unnamed protein product, partial [Fusarium equiseti]